MKLHEIRCMIVGICYISQNSDNDRLRYRLCNQVLQSLFLLIFLIYNFHCYRRQWQNLSLLLKWLNFSHSAISPVWFPVFTQVSLQNKRFQCMITTVPVILQTSSIPVKTRRQRIPKSKPKNTNTRQRIRVQQWWWGDNRPRSPLYLGNRGRMDYVRV